MQAKITMFDRNRTGKLPQSHLFPRVLQGYVYCTHPFQVPLGKTAFETRLSKQGQVWAAIKGDRFLTVVASLPFPRSLASQAMGDTGMERLTLFSGQWLGIS